MSPLRRREPPSQLSQLRIACQRRPCHTFIKRLPRSMTSSTASTVSSTMSSAKLLRCRRVRAPEHGATRIPVPIPTHNPVTRAVAPTMRERALPFITVSPFIWLSPSARLIILLSNVRAKPAGNSCSFVMPGMLRAYDSAGNERRSAIRNMSSRQGMECPSSNPIHLRERWCRGVVLRNGRFCIELVCEGSIEASHQLSEQTYRLAVNLWAGHRLHRVVCARPSRLVD